MAKTATRDEITIYLMNGEYIVRSKSSLTGKRVKRDPAFARTMEYAGWLKKASPIASLVYRQMPEGREYRQYRELVGKAMGLLKHGCGVDEVLGVLELVYLPEDLLDEMSEGQAGNGDNGDNHGNDGRDVNVENIGNVTVKSAVEWLRGEYNGCFLREQGEKRASLNRHSICTSKYTG